MTSLSRSHLKRGARCRNGDEMTKVKFLGAVTSIRWGTDTYGPYDKNQVVDLPPDLVQELMPKGLIAEVLGEFKGGKEQTLATFLPEAQEAKVVVPSQKPEQKPAPRPAATEVKPASKTVNYDKLLELADGGDYLELFASAGHGKSRFLAFIALEVIRAGKRVIFLDCEHSLPKRIQKELGDSYKRLDFMDLDGLVAEVANLPLGLDLICFDSIGFPVLISYAKMNMKERGDALLKTILLRGYMKHYAENYDVLALGANQPKSELWGASHDVKTKDLEEKTPPVGGKSIHIAKGVIRMSVESKKEGGESVFGLRAFECQDQPFNKLLAKFTIDDKGEKIEWKI